MLGVQGGIAVAFEEMEMAREERVRDAKWEIEVREERARHKECWGFTVGSAQRGGATSSNLECAALMGSWAGTGRTGVLCTV